MKVLVTGCAGFIGSKVCEILLNEEHTVIGVDNFNDAYGLPLKEWRLARLEDAPGFTLHRLDITDCRALGRLFEEGNIEAIINLAARVGVRQSLDDPWVYYQTNVIGTLNLLELCRRNGVKKFVLSSTSSVYGNSACPFNEDAPTDRSISPYATSKKAAEASCYPYHSIYGLDVTVLRYFTVYGPAGRPDMAIFRFINQIAEGKQMVLYGDGAQERDFTYIDDIARGTVLALKPLGYEIINLGCDRPVTVNGVIARIEKCLGEIARVETASRHPADVIGTWADITKAKRLLGWEPRISLEEGLLRSVEWYKQNRTLANSLV